MDILKAREIIRALADGVDPSTGEILAKDVIRALYTMLEITTPQPVRPLDPLRNAGKPWTKVEDDKLIEEFAEKIKISDIAKEHGRT